MIDRLIESALRQRIVILVGALLLVVLGLYAFRVLPIDAFPDVTNIQVQVITEAPGRSPIEVEQLFTYPIEVQMTGLPKLSELRSLSKFGLSVVTVVFEDNVDLYFARQLVLERLIEAKEKLPAGAEPTMGPISTGLGEIYQYTLERPSGGEHPSDPEADLMELRTIEDWIVRPILKTVPGVTDVNAFGGFVKEYQVLVDPDRLRKYDLTLREVFESVARNNTNAGGNVMERSSERFLIRGVGLIKELQDIRDIVVKAEKGTPTFVKDVAEVRVGPAVREGALVKDGKGEGVAGIVMMIRGGSGMEVVAGVKKKVEEINRNKILPGGVTIKPFYDRTDLVEKSVHTVTRALEEGAILLAIVLYLFLRNLRGALVVALTLPLAVLSTFIVMWKTGLSANLMSLGGLAISLGMIVDAAIIQVENVQRHLSEHPEGKPNKLQIVLRAILEVRKPSLFGELIIAITFIPIITLQGMEGKMFAPLAFTVVIALLSSLLLSMSVIPVFCFLFLKKGEETESFLVRGANRIYLPLLSWSLRHRIGILSGAIFLLAGSVALVPFLGTEFIPSLDEGSLSPAVIRLPSVSLPESIEMEKKVQQVLLKFPEAETIVSKLGAAEIATDPQGPNLSDPILILKPRNQWKSARTKKELVEKMREALDQIPGISYSISQPIAMRVDELISGIKSQVAIKVFGDDLDLLEAKAEEIARVISKVRGVADLRVEQTAGQPYMTIEIDRRKIARYGINVADIQEIIETAIGGKKATEVFEGERRFGLVVRFPEDKRNSLEAISAILVSSPSGARIPLAELTKLSIVDGPAQISRENSKRRIVVEFNVEGRDIGSLVSESQRLIREKVNLPEGYYLAWGGAFENQQRAMKRLMIIVPLVMGLIFFLLFMTFNSLHHAALIILNLPFALIGGILGLLLSGFYLSVPASVGFISLFGVAVLNGVVLVTYMNQLAEEGLPLREAILKGCERRLRPVLMTASVAILGLIPMLFATGPGSEIQKPLATVVIGGLISSTLLTLLVLPTLYDWLEGHHGRKEVSSIEEESHL
ncbi:efflux RND transporter permease subunit [Candidatus Manganitrophus noduliformans]|uniref:Efflux RND transporter permease subunit n=1 Tax=Candidatus Manganitrophus noduliformans TaxID=2606439 RepID=A0A7X6DU89_9BACT|nr:CusA/CzcA family heavy metal efflux RND transporter [Candidatus Manganitrophus noduliformans]NKE73520.1 efflux RND transporter permease subunit [Candidatus Manganitrophus noduliformans]